MKTAVAMGMALALLGGVAWGATVDAPAPVPVATPVEAALATPETTLPGAEAEDPFAVREKPSDGALALLGLDKSSPLPDPASWAMMIIGFFGAGYLLRSGRSGGRRVLRAARAAAPARKRDAATH